MPSSCDKSCDEPILSSWVAPALDDTGLHVSLGLTSRASGIMGHPGAGGDSGHRVFIRGRVEMGWCTEDIKRMAFHLVLMEVRGFDNEYRGRG